MKKLLLAGTTVLLMAAPASAQSTSPAAAFFGGGTGFGVMPRITVPCRPSNAWYAPHPYYPEKPCPQQTKMKRNKR
jgi:hypothetical protein